MKLIRRIRGFMALILIGNDEEIANLCLLNALQDYNLIHTNQLEITHIVRSLVKGRKKFITTVSLGVLEE